MTRTTTTARRLRPLVLLAAAATLMATGCATNTSVTDLGVYEPQPPLRGTALAAGDDFGVALQARFDGHDLGDSRFALAGEPYLITGGPNSASSGRDRLGVEPVNVVRVNVD